MYAPVFGWVFTQPLFDDRLCLMLNETRRNYYRSVYCFTLFKRNVALQIVSHCETHTLIHVRHISLRFQLSLRIVNYSYSSLSRILANINHYVSLAIISDQWDASNLLLTALNGLRILARSSVTNMGMYQGYALVKYNR